MLNARIRVDFIEWSVNMKYEFVDEKTFKVNGTLLDMNDAVDLLNMKDEQIRELENEVI